MTNLKKRERAKTNASLISMVQRFSDITIMFAGLWLVCEVSGLSFLYMHLLVALITLVVFQMLGGITKEEKYICLWHIGDFVFNFNAVDVAFFVKVVNHCHNIFRQLAVQSSTKSCFLCKHNRIPTCNAVSHTTAAK